MSGPILSISEVRLDRLKAVAVEILTLLEFYGLKLGSGEDSTYLVDYNGDEILEIRLS